MRTPTLSAVGFIALLVTCGAVILPPAATATWLGDYYPLIMNAVWTYENAAPPYDQPTRSVFDYLLYDGNPAVRVGFDWYEHLIAFNDGHTVTIYAEVYGGVLYPYTETVMLGEFRDGDHFEICPGGDCETLMIRDWDAIDPTLRAAYDIDPALDDLIVIASYDPGLAANVHNALLASNLPAGVEPPPGAVGSIDWYQRDVGLAVVFGIDSASGGVNHRYDLVDYVVAVDDRPDTPHAVTLARIYPNPFNPAATIRFTLSRDADTVLTIHDAAGRLIRTIDDGTLRAAGTHTAIWRGVDDRGRPQASGTYYCRLSAAGEVRTMTMTLAR